MQDELEDHPEDYCSLTYEDWSNLLSTIEVKCKRKRVASQIKNIASARAASLFDSYAFVRIPRNKKSRIRDLHSNKPQKKAHNHHGTQRYCVLFNKAGIAEKKYMSQSDEYYTGILTNRTIKDGMKGYVESRSNTVKKYNKSENKWRKYLKNIKKQNKILYSIAKKSGSLHDIKNIKNIRGNLLRRVATLVAVLTVTIWTPIPCYPAIPAGSF